MKHLVAALFVLSSSLPCLAVEQGASKGVFLKEAQNVLAPLQFVKFCMNYSSECAQSSPEARLPAQDVALSTLAEVNASVNQAISPVQKSTDPLLARWTISPSSGDCNDYAITKRHLLLAKGWPASALRLAVVYAPAGGHLVLIVRLQDGDYVLDNLVPDVRDWRRSSYLWVSMESGEDPRFWVSIAKQDHRDFAELGNR
ncbi:MULTISPECIES: transglutaminase-like cysteine peptidase [Bradyrhizobium]|uniref:transglutaminase-like cysteine peptidase n=1 Tax=Bradyrhizobium TaxID=374 RepID=UPI001B8A24A7|nr:MULTISPECIES: transglutaminase-like cysteine peptidase [Bradyrhizobium]MBR0969962.1 transglutaminase-like cysteine peptidase [Bradyrhizobium japonicum]